MDSVCRGGRKGRCADLLQAGQKVARHTRGVLDLSTYSGSISVRTLFPEEGGGYRRTGEGFPNPRRNHKSPNPAGWKPQHQHPAVSFQPLFQINISKDFIF